MKQNDCDAITPHLPTQGFLGEFLHFTRNLEMCPRFRLFSALCIMGAAINNKVWIQRGDEGLLPKFMPNVWVILLGPPFRGHKTSCISLAAKVLIQGYPEARILADKLTPETVVKALSSAQDGATPDGTIRIGPPDAVGLIQAPEMSVIFGKQQYNTGMVALITDLYDYRETWVSETIGRGKVTLKNNCISIITGSTPKWLHSMIPQDAFTGGFMRRFIIVELPPNYYIRNARPKRPESGSWERVIEAFKPLCHLKGQMNWTEEGGKRYDDLYENFRPTGDESYDAYCEAQSEQILKTAMLLDLNRGQMDLTAESLKQAINIFDSISYETRMRIQSLTTHPRMNIVQEIEQILETVSSINEGELLKRVYRFLSQGERQFYEALSILKRTGAIQIQGRPGNFSYKLAKKGGKSCGSVEPSAQEVRGATPSKGRGGAEKIVIRDVD